MRMCKCANDIIPEELYLDNQLNPLIFQCINPLGVKYSICTSPYFHIIFISTGSWHLPPKAAYAAKYEGNCYHPGVKG